MNRLIDEDVIVRFLRRKGVEVEPCAGCHNDELDGYESFFYVELDKKRCVRMSCSVYNAWSDVVYGKPRKHDDLPSPR